MEKSSRIDFKMRFVSRSTEPVWIWKYTAAIAVKLLIEGELKRERYGEKNGNHCFVIILALMDGGIIVQITISLLPTIVSWKALKEDSESTDPLLVLVTEWLLLVVVIITVVVMASKSRTTMGAMCHVTLKRVRLCKFVVVTNY